MSWSLVRRVALGLLATAVAAGYSVAFLALLSIAPRVADSVLELDYVVGLAVYTLASYCVPVALAVLRCLRLFRVVDARRSERVLLIVSAVNWLPLCVALTGWSILSRPNAWIP